jgi:hypothetical protein
MKQEFSLLHGGKNEFHADNETHCYHDNIVENPDCFNWLASSLARAPNSPS